MRKPKVDGDNGKKVKDSEQQLLYVLNRAHKEQKCI